MILQGTNIVNVDSKGRIAIPTRFRDCLLEHCAGKLVMTAHGLDQCLVMYAANDWQAVALQYQNVPGATRRARNVKRRVLGQAEEIEMDGSSRILLPAHLRDFAKVNKKIVFTGAGDHFELWAESIWNDNEDLSGTIDDIDDLPEAMQNLPF